MDQWDSYCPYLLSSEPTAKGTGLAESAGKEDPVEFDSSLTLWNGVGGVDKWEPCDLEKPLLLMSFYLFR